MFTPSLALSRQGLIGVGISPSPQPSPIKGEGGLLIGIHSWLHVCLPLRDRQGGRDFKGEGGFVDL